MCNRILILKNSKNIRIDRVSELQGEYLTFTADKLGTGYLSTVLGVFNAKTLKVEWVYEFTPDKKISLSTLPPVLDGNRLYALDTKKNLHVFEEVS